MFHLFDLILYVPVKSFPVMSGQVFLGLTSTKQRIKCLAQEHHTVAPMRLLPATPRSQVKHSTTEPPRFSGLNVRYSKTCLKRPLKNRQTKVLKTNSSLMKFESIAECSPWSILQYFWPALSDNQSWKLFFDLLRVAVLDRFYCI